jgi:hypothetical protein
MPKNETGIKRQIQLGNNAFISRNHAHTKE